jgi:hypothetical protein
VAIVAAMKAPTAVEAWDGGGANLRLYTRPVPVPTN